MIPVSPGVYTEVLDFSQYARQLSTTQLVLVGTASKGLINVLTSTVDQTEFVNKFGAVNGMNHMQMAAMQFLRRGNNLQILRIAGSKAIEGYALFEDSSEDAVLKLASIDKGSYLNGYRIAITAGSIALTFKIVLSEPDDANGFPGRVLETYDNIVINTTGAPAGSTLVTDAINGISEYLTAEIIDEDLTLELASMVIALGDDGVEDDLGAAIIGTISGNVKTGLQILYNAEAIEFNLIAVPGMVQQTVYNELKNLCISRGDCMMFVDPPVDKANSKGIPTLPYEVDREGGRATANINTAQLSIMSMIGGTGIAVNAIEILDTVTRKSEKVIWTPLKVTIEVEAGVSTVADVLRAAEYPQGDPWAVLGSNTLTPDATVVSALVSTLMSALPGYSAGTNYSVCTTDDQQKWHNAIAPMEYNVSTRKWGLSSALNITPAALYGWWVKYYSQYTGRYYWTAPSGHAAAVFAQNDNLAYPWFAPAGFNRAILPEGLDVQYSPDQGNRDILQGGSNCFNSIVNFTPEGITVWGQRTLQRAASAMDRINVVRMVLYARKVIATASRRVVFEPNDTATWSQLRGLINPVLREIASKRGLYEFKVIIDTTINTPATIDQNRLIGKIYLKPTKTAEAIELGFIITSTGANFEEI